jgi:hypothetical protein
MKKLIKREWIERMRRNPTQPPSYILNKMYEEVEGTTLLIPNRYKLRKGASTAPKYLEVGMYDPIQPAVLEWAGLTTMMPKLPSYHKYGGIGLRSNNHILDVIHAHGAFMDEGLATKATNVMDKFLTCVEEDL